MDVFLYSKILSVFALCSHITLIVFFVLNCIKLPFIQKTINAIKKILQKNGLLYALCITIFATTGPLIFSHVYHFEPCTLCWYQRVSMFPLAVILLIANIRKDYRIKIYIYILSALGLCVGIYHYITQQLYTHFAIYNGGCDAAGIAKTCSEYYFIEFGYITIPVMAITGFTLIIFFTYFAKQEMNKQKIE